MAQALRLKEDVELPKINREIMDSHFQRLMNDYNMKGYKEPLSLVTEDQFSLLNALKEGLMVSDQIYEDLKRAEWDRVGLHDATHLQGLTRMLIGRDLQYTEQQLKVAA